MDRRFSGKEPCLFEVPSDDGLGQVQRGSVKGVESNRAFDR